MTAKELNTLIQSKQKVIFIDVREVGEYMKLNIGGNRMNTTEVKSNIEALKRLNTEGYKFVVGCVHFESYRIPEMTRLLLANGITCEVLWGSKVIGGGILSYVNKYRRTQNIPKVDLK